MADVVELVDDETERLGRATLLGEEEDEFGDVLASLADAGGEGKGVIGGVFEEDEKKVAGIGSQEFEGGVGVVRDESTAFRYEKAVGRCCCGSSESRGRLRRGRRAV